MVLITGAGGEIGHGLIEQLVASGRDSIVTLDLNPLEPSLGTHVQREFTGSINDTRAARSHPLGVRDRYRLSPRRAAVDALRVHARSPRIRSTSRAR